MELNAVFCLCALVSRHIFECHYLPVSTMDFGLLQRKVLESSGRHPASEGAERIDPTPRCQRCLPQLQC